MMMTWVRMRRIQSRLGRGQNDDEKLLPKVVSTVNADSDSEAPNLKSVNDNGHGNDNLLKQWREAKRDDDYDRYDDDLYESHDTSQNLQGICDDFDIYFDVC
ncbi:hypothetical protein Tco_1478332 [Tanacetum coccineum]